MFVSRSTGSDGNPGTVGSPKQTLAAASRYCLPGANIWLKAGDTWTGEQLTVQGGGTYATTAYDSSYTSTLTSQLAVYKAGAIYLDDVAKLTVAGANPTDADTYATLHCHYLAHVDATRAAKAAADSASTWVTIGRYGAGADPIIDGAGSKQCCVRIVDGFGTGAWKILVQLKGATVCGVDMEMSGKTNGLHVQVPSITGITGMPIPAGRIGSTPQVAGFANAWPSSVTAKNVNHIYYKAGEVTGCGTPGMFFECADVFVDTPNMHDCTDQSLWFIGTAGDRFPRVLIDGGVITKMMTGGWLNGTAGVALVDTDDVVYNGTEISHTTQPLHESDGVASDQELSAHNTGYLGCSLTNNSGPASLILVGTTDSGTLYADCTFSNNGTFDTTVSPIICRCDATPGPVVFLRNQSFRSAPGQKLFAATSHLTPAPTDTPNANWFYGPDNTVT